MVGVGFGPLDPAIDAKKVIERRGHGYLDNRIDGNATLAGTVAVDFGDAAPPVGSVYTLLTAGSIAGDLTVSLPAGVFGQLDYAAGRVTLEIADSAPDDIFADGFDGGAIIR